MHRKMYIQLDSAGICFHEFEYSGSKAPKAGAALIDVTSRSDGPWLGKKYDAKAGTFSWPAPEVSFMASASSIVQGEKVTLSWETQHTVSAEISVTGGTVIHRCEPVHAGAVEVEPGQTATYTLTATGRAGTTPATQRRRVTVT